MDGWTDGQIAFQVKNQKQDHEVDFHHFGGWGVHATMLSEVALALMALPWQFS